MRHLIGWEPGENHIFQPSTEFDQCWDIILSCPALSSLQQPTTHLRGYDCSSMSGIAGGKNVLKTLTFTQLLSEHRVDFFTRVHMWKASHSRVYAWAVSVKAWPSERSISPLTLTFFPLMEDAGVRTCFLQFPGIWHCHDNRSRTVQFFPRPCLPLSSQRRLRWVVTSTGGSHH